MSRFDASVAAVAEVAWETRSRLDLDPTFFLSVDSNELHSGPEAVVIVTFLCDPRRFETQWRAAVPSVGILARYAKMFFGGWFGARPTTGGWQRPSLRSLWLASLAS